MLIKVDKKRVGSVAKAIKGLGVSAVLKIEEDDPQYIFISRLKEVIGESKTLILTILISLASYRLSVKGEDWWRCFSNYFIKNKPNNFNDITGKAVSFIESCRGAVVQREIKKRRVQKVAKTCERILRYLFYHPEELESHYKDLLECESKALGQKRYSKTLVFSIKMGYYAVRDLLKPPVNIKIEMPVDVRVACLTYSSGMLLSSNFRKLIEYPYQAQEVWNTIEKLSGIPVIHLDALIWRLGWIPREYSNVERAREIMRKILIRYAERDVAEILSRELIYKKCQ